MSVGSGFGPPAERPDHRRRPAQRGRRRAALLAVAIVAASCGAVAGGIAGWVAADRASHDGAAAPLNGTASTLIANAPANGSTSTRSAREVADVPAIAEALRSSVVSINVVATVPGPYGRPVDQRGAGTGFVVSASGQIATNNHVIAGAASIEVVLADGATLPATVVGTSSTEDLAVLQIDRTGLVPVRLGTSANLQVGETVVAIGNALALPGGPTVSAGIVSALGRALTVGSTNYADLLQTDAAISSGNSGGPLVDHDGLVVGINSAAASSASAESIGLAIAIDHALPVLRSLGASI
jgi:serine protease Do